MTTLLVILASVVIVGVLAVFWEIRKLRQARGGSEENQVLMEWLKEMREDQRHTGRQVQEANRALGERLDHAAKVISTLNTEVGRMQKMGESIEEMQQIFKSPKLRGNVGENLMRDILAECLPRTKYKLQHGFKNGVKVDAVILTRSGLIPVDSKFPLEKYLAAQKLPEEQREPLLKEFHRQVRKHIDDISRKYIQPSEDTVDYAFMYVPGEPIFYDIYNTTDLYDHATAKKVILVSPNYFYIFLQLVLMGMEGEQIEEKAKQVLAELRSIQQDSSKLGLNLDLLHKHLHNARNTLDAVGKSHSALDTRIRNAGQLQEEQKRVAKRQLEGLTEASAEIGQAKDRK